MFKKILGLTMSMIMLTSLNATNRVYAVNVGESNTSVCRIDNIDNCHDLENVDSSAEALVIEEKKLEDFDRDEIEEVLDDGVCVIELKSEEEEINNFFDKNVCEEDNSEVIIGYKIEKNGEEVCAEPISIKAVDIDGEIIEDRKEYEELIDSVKLNDEDYSILLEDDGEKGNMEQLSKGDIALLQASNSIGSSYAEQSRTTYYYGKSGFWSADTKALKKGKSPGSGWNKMGFSTINLSVYNVGGKGKKRYDLFMGGMRLGALNGYILTDFTGQIRLYDQNKCEIIDSSILKGDINENVSTTIGAELEAEESGISASLSAGYTYSYNPNGMKIINTSGDSELQPNWKCSKSWKHCEKNEVYRIRPSIVVKSPKGKSTQTKVSMRVKNLRFEGTYTVYNVANRTGSEYVYLEVCNHKKVK